MKNENKIDWNLVTVPWQVLSSKQKRQALVGAVATYGLIFAGYKFMRGQDFGAIASLAAPTVTITVASMAKVLHDLKRLNTDEGWTEFTGEVDKMMSRMEEVSPGYADENEQVHEMWAQAEPVE